MSTLALPLFTGSSLFLQVILTAIKSWMGLKFGKIGPRSAELANLERLKNLHRPIMGKMLWALKCFYF